MQYAFHSSGQRERKTEVQDELDELLKWCRQPETRASKSCLIHESLLVIVNLFFQIATPRMEFLQIQVTLWSCWGFVSFVSGVSNRRWCQLYGAPMRMECVLVWWSHSKVQKCSLAETWNLFSSYFSDQLVPSDQWRLLCNNKRVATT